MAEIVDINPYGNTFSKLCIASLALWGGTIIAQRAHYPSPAYEHSKNQRYKINSETRLNKSILSANFKHNIPTKINDIFAKRRRFRK